jgi:hypothetical protein
MHIMGAQLVLEFCVAFVVTVLPGEEHVGDLVMHGGQDAEIEKDAGDVFHIVWQTG